MIINPRASAILAMAALALCACKSMSYDQVTTSVAAGGAQLNASGLTLGYAQSRTSVNPAVDQSGKAITTADACGAQYPLSTYSILAGNATATANAPSSAGQSAAIAINEGQATGEAATELARAEVARAVGPGYDVERAARDCSHTTAAIVATKPGS